MNGSFSWDADHTCIVFCSFIPFMSVHLIILHASLLDFNDE